MEDLTKKNGCSNMLNIEACLNQDDICKFYNNNC